MSKEQKKSLEFLQRFADVFGFQVTPKGLLYGKYNDLEVELIHDNEALERSITSNSFTGGTSWTILRCLNCTVKFPHPLNLSLNLQAPKALPNDANPNNIVIGHPAFDSRFDAVCINQEMLQKLLSNKNPSDDKNLLSEILQTNHYVETANQNEIATKLNETPKYLRSMFIPLTYHLFIITDTDVTIKINCDFYETSEQSIKQILDQTTYIAKQIYTARLNLN